MCFLYIHILCADGEYLSLLGASHLHASINRQQQEVQPLLKISAIVGTITLKERVMVTPQTSLLYLTVESGVPDGVMRHLKAERILCMFLVMTDFLRIWLMMHSNTTCDEDSNKHVTRIQMQHVTRIRIQHVTRI